MSMDKAKRASWARALFGKGDEEDGEVLEGAGRMPSVPSNNNAQAQQLMQRQSVAAETKAMDAALPEAQAAVWKEPAPVPTGESWYGEPLDITQDLEEVWGKPTPTGTSQASGQTPEAVATPGDGWKGKQQTDAWVGGGGWSYARINTQDGEIIQATNPKSGKVVEVKPGMKNADGMDLFTLIDTERQNQLMAGSTAPTDEMKRQASAEIASVTPSKGDMEKVMSMGKDKPAAKAKPKPVLGQEEAEYMFGPSIDYYNMKGETLPYGVQASMDRLSGRGPELDPMVKDAIANAGAGSGAAAQPKTMQFNGREVTIDQVGTLQESLNPFVKGITAVDTLTGQPMTFQPGTPEFMEAATLLAGGQPPARSGPVDKSKLARYDQEGTTLVPGVQSLPPADSPLWQAPATAPAGTAPAKPGATGGVYQVDDKKVIVVGGYDADPRNPGLKTPLMVVDQQTGQAIPQNSPAYAKAIKMAGVK